MQMIQEIGADSSAQLIRDLIASSETRNLEFKRVSGKMVGKALETVCALADADGGTLVLGVADLKDFSRPRANFRIGQCS